MARISLFRHIRFGLAAAFVGIALLVAMFVFLEGREGPGPQEKSPPPESGVEEMAKGLTLTEMSEEGVRWKLDAKKAVRHRGTKEIFFRDVSMVLYLENGESISLVGPEGNYDLSDQDMEIQGGVVVNYSRGYTLKTDAIRYMAKKNYISGDSALTFEGSGIFLKGRSFRFDLNRENISVKGPVRCRLVSKGSTDARG